MTPSYQLPVSLAFLLKFKVAYLISKVRSLRLLLTDTIVSSNLRDLMLQIR